MDSSEEAQIERRRACLSKEISYDYEHYRKLAQANYFSSIGSVWLGLICAAVAGATGLLDTAIPKPVLGALAMIPAALAVVERTVKFQKKANYFYRAMDLYNSLRRRLEYQIPLKATAEDNAAVSDAYSAIDTELTSLWESTIGLAVEADASQARRRDKDATRLANRRTNPSVMPD
jgi:hypothetical protein